MVLGYGGIKILVRSKVIDFAFSSKLKTYLAIFSDDKISRAGNIRADTQVRPYTMWLDRYIQIF